MVKILVEGGGNSTLNRICRQAFHQFLNNAGIHGEFTVIACGSRYEAFNLFNKEYAKSRKLVMLVDSEQPVRDAHHMLPWEHLKLVDKVESPKGAGENQCHLMTQCMETWFLADTAALQTYYGSSFNNKKLSGNQIEEIPKDKVIKQLNDAVAKCSKNRYDKGRDSFLILMKLDPRKVESASPWATRFIKDMRELIDHSNHENTN